MSTPPSIVFVPRPNSSTSHSWPEFHCIVTKTSTLKTTSGASRKNAKSEYSNGLPPPLTKRSTSSGSIIYDGVTLGDVKDKLSSSNSNEYTVYHLHVKAATSDTILEWETQRRYSEFLSLHHFLVKHLSISDVAKELSFVKQLKSLFPKKSLINKSEKIISLRRNQFTEYLVALLRFLNSEKLLKSPKTLSDAEFINPITNCVLGFLDIDNRFVSHHFQYRETSAPHLVYFDKVKIQKRDLWMELNALEISLNNNILSVGKSNENVTLDENSQNFMSQQFRQMHRLNDEIRELTLRGDMYIIEKSSQKKFLLNISSFSRIYIYPVQDLVSFKTQMSLAQQHPYEFEAVLYNQMSGNKRSIPISTVLDVQLLPQTFQPNGCSKMRILFRDGSTYTFYSRSRTDIEHTITTHLKRYQKNREGMIQNLKQALVLKRTPYDMDNQEHEAMLMSLWNNVFPDIPMKNRNELSLWSRLGFQSEPSKDFRGAGYGSLHFLVYCATNYTKQFRYIADQNRDYPISVAGINVIDQIFRMLNVQDWDDMRTDDPRWDEQKIFRFVTEQYIYTENPLEEFFCFFLFLLDHTFVEGNGNYFSFGDQMNKTKKKICDILDTENALSFRVLYETCFTEEYLKTIDIMRSFQM